MNLAAWLFLAAAESVSAGSKTRYAVLFATPANPDASHSMCFKSPLAEAGCAKTCCCAGYNCAHAWPPSLALNSGGTKSVIMIGSPGTHLG